MGEQAFICLNGLPFEVNNNNNNNNNNNSTFHMVKIRLIFCSFLSRYNEQLNREMAHMTGIDAHLN